jgi:hypothetical protein
VTGSMEFIIRGPLFGPEFAGACFIADLLQLVKGRVCAPIDF